MIYTIHCEVSVTQKVYRRMPRILFLCRNDRLTELIVWDAHNRIKHLGERQTLTKTRSCYWIPRGKSFVKKVLHHCITCKRFNSRPYS